VGLPVQSRIEEMNFKEMATRPCMPTIDEQQSFWDSHWQQKETRKVLNEWTERRAKEILQLIRRLGIQRPRMLDLGCGFGWFTERLADLGEAQGIDLSPEGIAAARTRRPDISYLVGSVYDAPLPKNYFDIVVSQEVIAHVEDQPKYLERAADVLKAGGFLIITTGNKFVIDRLGDVGWHVYQSEHIERQLSRRQLRKLLTSRFDVLEDFTIIPHGTRGILRLINSYRLNTIVGKLISSEKLDALKEKAGFGWQVILLAQKRS
jgi:2-polyprenyl-3-methyl-5-hydroxy-6-metoxy-1,4-benzoquinol methylase